jgi:uncharacterized iron-regulated membrane protein
MWAQAIGRSVWRAAVLAHRYLGIAVGLLMVMWFASGLVMMYVPYPQVAGAERLRFQEPIAWAACCKFGTLADQAEIVRVQLENHLGVPAARVRVRGQADSLLDLSLGARVPIGEDTARAAAHAAAPNIIGQPATIIGYDQVPFDQFTLGRAQRDRPLHRFKFDDPERTTIYVSGTTGQVVMWITSSQRFWNWLGTIPHFLYFESLRTQQQLWSQTVIWTSLLGTFLTVLGLVLGIGRFKGGRNGRLSPYRGWFYWHHMVGLAFGLFTLAWVFSGLVSMNPWGFLESRGRGDATAAQGSLPTWGDIRASIATLRSHASLSNVVSLTTAPLNGRLLWMATFDDGTVARLDAMGNTAPLTIPELEPVVARIAGIHGVLEQRLVNDEDDYYYPRQRRRFEQVVLPVYRVIINDDEQTRYYLNPNTGDIVQRVDAAGRWRRWLFSGLHRLDFAAWMRARPFRDVMMWLTLLGGLAASGTGMYLGMRRVQSDVTGAFRRVRRGTEATTRIRPDTVSNIAQSS